MLQRGYGVTTIMATNDGVDAMTLADRVVVLDRGRVIQFATPDVVRRSPASLAAAVAAGDVSCFPAELLSDADGDRIVRRGASGVVEFRHPVSSHEAIGGSRAVVVAVRPNDVLLDPSGPIDAVVERPRAGPRAFGLVRIRGRSSGGGRPSTAARRRIAGAVAHPPGAGGRRHDGTRRGALTARSHDRFVTVSRS